MPPSQASKPPKRTSLDHRLGCFLAHDAGCLSRLDSVEFSERSTVINLYCQTSLMSQLQKETVTDVHHWSDKLFSIKTTRNASLRFRNGQFAMLGIEVDGKPLMRAYSMASANYEDHLEFYSIKVQEGELTSRLQHIQVGDALYISKKPTGTLLWDRLLAGKRLYLLSTGTGLAPFLSIIKDPDVYENFEPGHFGAWLPLYQRTQLPAADHRGVRGATNTLAIASRKSCCTTPP